MPYAPLTLSLSPQAVAAGLVLLAVIMLYDWCFKGIAMDTFISLHLFLLLPYQEVEKLKKQASQNLQAFSGYRNPVGHQADVISDEDALGDGDARVRGGMRKGAGAKVAFAKKGGNAGAQYLEAGMVGWSGGGEQQLSVSMDNLSERQRTGSASMTALTETTAHGNARGLSEPGGPDVGTSSGTEQGTDKDTGSVASTESLPEVDLVNEATSMTLVQNEPAHEYEDDEDIFLEYLGDLLQTGEFFLKFNN